MKYKIIIPPLATLLLISIIGIGQLPPPPPNDFPPPPPMSVEEKKMSKASLEEIKEDIRKNANHLENTSVGDLIFNWEDADLWAIEKNDESNISQKVLVLYLNMLFTNPTYSIKDRSYLDGSLFVQHSKVHIKMDGVSHKQIVEMSLKTKYPEMDLSMLYTSTSDKIGRTIYNIRNIGIQKKEGIMGEIIETEDSLYIIHYTYYGEKGTEFEEYWINRFKNINLK